MAEEKWYEMNLELEELYSEKTLESILEYVEENTTMLYKYISGDKISNAFGTLQYGRAIQEEMLNKMKKSFPAVKMLDEKGLEIAYSEIVEMAQLFGIIKASTRLCTEKRQQLLIEKECELYFDRVTHLNDVLLVLEKNNHLSHSELCEKLNLQPSTLTERMKEIIQTDCVEFRHEGKYKIYSITDRGRRYRRTKKLRDHQAKINSLRAKERQIKENSSSYDKNSLAGHEKDAFLSSVGNIITIFDVNLRKGEKYTLKDLWGTFSEGEESSILFVEKKESLEDIFDEREESPKYSKNNKETKDYTEILRRKTG